MTIMKSVLVFFFFSWCLPFILANQMILYTPNEPWIKGNQVEILWNYLTQEGEVPSNIGGKIQLMQYTGNELKLQPYLELTRIDEPWKKNSFTYTVASSIPSGNYVMRFEWDGQPTSTYRYTAAFPVQEASSSSPSSNGQGGKRGGGGQATGK